MTYVVVVLLVLVGLAAAALLLWFGVGVVAYNINDIVHHGASFWNIFWLALVAFILLGGIPRISLARKH